MEKKLFKIDKFIREGIEKLKNKEFIEVDDAVFDILIYYQDVIEKQKNDLEQLNRYKERELDAFAIGDAVSDGICIVDKNGIVTAINKGYTEITEINEQDIVGKHIEEAIKQGMFNNAVSMLVIKDKKKVTSLATIGKNNKKVLITGNPIFNRNGEVEQVLTVMRDLTELIKLKDKLEKTEKKNEKYLNELNYYRNKAVDNRNFIGESPNMKEIKELIKYVAKTEATILITGETGSGKEVVAKEIHDKSDRRKEPYIKVNCAAIPESLIESELFGYEKGAFTGALNKEKLGMFEMANGGTILLDEIGEMPLNLQSKLLRVLQEKEIMRLGGTKSIKLDVRVIASTNRDLKELIKQGKFREDLFYRLNVLPIKIPALKDRKEDISILAQTFLDKFNIKYGKNKNFDSLAIQALEYYDWPGNVRELQNVIERLTIIDDEKYITYNQVSNIIGNNKIPSDNVEDNLLLKDALARVEKEIIERALRKYGSTYKAAKVLGVTQPTVFRKAKALGIKLSNEVEKVGT
ncbi:sigma 54-interacting transcriptional regulator [Clostridium sp. SYSU_GA19001]|uniref:sigma-54 interaction domain-containing protein n=1 Tax=Clostridium caldaquaticum TaxID=2940653 RepID=UPI0020778214|nr:sigma 54-interacting transcriptional regulator [Clostridium caldaquaticum]MCM8711224.1 sigma 54-interacting transcriptional regulator [Clostridium caldaquaticum]